MNLTEIARRLKIPTKELKEKLPELGFDIGMKAIKVPDDMAARIIEKWKEEKKRERIADKYADVDVVEKVEEDKSSDRIIKVPQSISVRDLADKFKINPPAMIAELMKHGVMASLSEKVDFDIITIVAEGMGFSVELTDEALDDEKIQQKIIQDKLKKIKDSATTGSSRPPVVVVMGHVDHGKTKLLDTIRNAKVIDTEAGGITQHIGAYQVKENGKNITFVDTPGHEAFSAMRSRGANVADVAILVVAADSGVQPQTIEAIKMIQDADLPMVIAINKIDKPEADVELIKKGLSEINIIPEDWGGDAICVEISAKEKTNLNELLDMVLLVADMNKDKIQAEYNAPASGTIIESHLDKGTGSVATVLIHNGTLKQGDAVRIGNVLGKIRTMTNFKGEDIKEATPSTPVRVIGLSSTPEVGEILEAGVDLKSLRRKLDSKKQLFVNNINVSEEKEEKKSKIKKLNIVLKTDVAGSQEAIIQSLKKYNTKQVGINIVYKGLGNITEVDVIRAESTKALVFGFNVSATSQAYEVSKEKEVDIKLYNVIYKLIEETEEKLEAMLEPIVTREVVAKAEVLAVFRGQKKDMIIGAKLKQGEVIDKCKIIVYRGEKIIGEGGIKELRVGPEKVSQVSSGDFGVQYSGSISLQEGDQLEFFIEKEEKQKLELK